MLSPADADLARRDPAIPGLATVLDPDAFLAALRQVTPAADLRAAYLTSVRYKPHTYCRLSYRLRVGEAELEAGVRASRLEDFAEGLKGHETASVSGALGPGQIAMADCVWVSLFPNDLKIEALPRLAGAAERNGLLKELLPDRPKLWRADLRCVRYRPELRYVAELRAAGESRALLKAYNGKGYRRGKRNAQGFQSRGAVRVAQLIGCLDDHRLLAFEWLPGGLLFDLWTAPAFDCKATADTGAALAALHVQDPPGLDCLTRETEVAEMLSLSADIGFLCPRLARRADALARRLAARLADAPVMRQPVHSDFSGKQVLVDGTNVAIIDLDCACRGDPADDLGNFIAQAERFALREVLTPSRVDSLREALLEGYARATNQPPPQRVGLYTTVGLFRRARSAFRLREPDWPQRTESLLERAEAVLTAN